MKNIKPTIKAISSAASIYFGVDVNSNTRKGEIRRPRQITHYIAHKIYGYSQADTGLVIGGKDHSTVLNSCRKVESEMEYSEKMRRDVSRCSALCENKDYLEPPDEICINLLRRDDVSAHAKIEIRKLLKIVKYENN